MNRAGSCNLQSCQSLCSAPAELPLGVLRPSHAEAAQEGPISSHGALWTNLCHRRNAVFGGRRRAAHRDGCWHCCGTTHQAKQCLGCHLVALPWDVLLPESSYPVIKRGITYITLGPGGGEGQKTHLHTPCTATHVIQVAAPLCTSAQHKLCSFCLAPSFPRTTVPCSGVAAIIVLLPPLGRNPPKQAHRPDLCTSRWFLFPGKWCSHWIKEGWDASGPCFLKSGELN